MELNKRLRERNTKYFWEFYYEHSSVLLIEKEEPERAASISVAFPKNWDVGAMITKKSTYIYPENPMEFDVFHVGRHSDLVIPLKSLSSLLCSHMGNILK